MGTRAASRNQQLAHTQNEFPRLLMEEANSNLAIQEKSTQNSSKEKTESYAAAAVEYQQIGSVCKDISFGKSGSEDEQPAHKMHGTNPGKKRIEEKLDYLIQQWEAMNSRAKNKSPVICKSPESMYRSLYKESEKIEALSNENHQLSLKLKVALAKLEAYESGSRALCSSYLAQGPETAVNLSSPPARGGLAPQEELLSHFVNRKRPTAKAPNAAAAKRQNQRRGMFDQFV